MGIRDRLGRDTRRYLGIGLAGWCVFVACLFMARPPAWLMIGAFIATCAALVSMLLFIRCPHCRAALSQIGFAAALAPVAASRYERCPGCGTRLD
jgi:DNA-directed RNA polymerase subunit RPC12/RpoP